jgi:hypothetical protein
MWCFMASVALAGDYNFRRFAEAFAFCLPKVGTQ